MSTSRCVLHTYQLLLSDHDFTSFNFPTDANTENVQESAAARQTARLQTDHKNTVTNKILTRSKLTLTQ